jgi:hypothetical protein
MARMLDPKDVLADLFAELLIVNSDELAKLAIERLQDAGFRIIQDARSE